MKYCKEIVAEICGYLKDGNSQADAAALSDISDETFHQWKRKYPEFAEALKKAQLICKNRNIKIIQKAAETTWQAGAWWLERKCHDEFALKNKMDLTSDGKPFTVFTVNYATKSVTKLPKKDDKNNAPA